MATSIENADESKDSESTNGEIVMAALGDATGPISLSELDDRIGDLSYKRISATLSDLSESDAIERHGKGGPHDPYRYEVNGDDRPANDALAELFDGEAEGDLSDVFEGGDDEDDGEYEYACLPDSSSESDVEYGTRYRCRVNGTEPYGVFVSLTTDPDWDNEVNGLVHKKRVPNLYSPDDFYPDDEVGVMLFDQNDDGLEFEMVAAFDTVRGLEFEQDPLHADDNDPPEDYEAALDRAKGDDTEVDDVEDGGGNQFEDLTHKEKRVVAALEAADGPLSTSEISTWLIDESGGGIGERLRDLSDRGVVERTGEGVRGDPYRYTVADVPVPPYAVEDLPPKPDQSTDADESETKTSREVAFEYVEGADGEDLIELWEAAGAIPDDIGVDLPGDTVTMGEDEWVDVVFAIGDSHISVTRTRELIKNLNRQVWGDGAKIDDREA